jgi:hypothetical protein
VDSITVPKPALQDFASMSAGRAEGDSSVLFDHGRPLLQMGDSSLNVVFRVSPWYKGIDPVVLPSVGHKRESGVNPELPRSGKWERTPHWALTAKAVGKPWQVGLARRP